ncbi:MAG: hypothetical protein IJK87_05750, partial [Prevotella sp.]|nr:hypothetical protein [Prevotella sp.]
RLNQEVLVGGYGVLFRVQFSESPKPENAYLIIRQLRDLTNFFPKSGVCGKRVVPIIGTTLVAL